MYIRSGVFEARNKKDFIIRHLISPLLLSKSPSFIYYLVKERFGGINQKESINLLMFWLCIFSVAYYFSVMEFVLLYWFVPLLTTFPMIGWFIELSEHYPIIENEREVYKSYNRFGSKFESFSTSMHNENYHLTHHLRADIPYWNIHKAHVIMLKDPDYREANQSFGGIFTSPNQNTKSIVSSILKEYDNLEVLP